MKDAHDNGTDEKLKTQFKLLGRILYSQGHASFQRSLVNKEILKENLSFSCISDPVRTVFAIFCLVVVNPPTAHVTRLLSSFQDVMQRRRSSSESLMSFATRFRSKASRHLSDAHTSPSSQFGEVLAITLLNNANLDEGPLRTQGFISSVMANIESCKRNHPALHLLFLFTASKIFLFCVNNFMLFEINFR